MTALKPGDRVCGVGDGGAFAEEWTVHQASVWRVPGEQGRGGGTWRQGCAWEAGGCGAFAEEWTVHSASVWRVPGA